MSTAAAALLRSVASRTKMQMQACGGSLPRPHPQRQPQAAAGVLSPRLLFHGSLPPMAAASRFFSSITRGSRNKVPRKRKGLPNKNLLPSSAEPAARDCVEDVVGDHQHEVKTTSPTLRNQPPWEIKRQIEEKKDELLHLLLQMDAEQSSSISGSEKCPRRKDQLPHLLREFQAKTQSKETPHLDAVVNFVFVTALAVFFARVVALLMM